MAHFKLLQHPLGKTKGSVLLSTVKYTHPPSSSSALPLSSQPAQELQSSPTAWRVRFTPGPVPGTPTLAVEPRLGKDAALEQHTHAVWIPSECHLLHAGIFILFFFFFLTSHRLQNSWQGNIYRQPNSQQFAFTCLCLQRILHCFLCLENWLCYQRKLLAAFCTIYLR